MKALNAKKRPIVQEAFESVGASSFPTLKERCLTILLITQQAGCNGTRRQRPRDFIAEQRERWIHCTPSALLAEAAGSKSSVYAEEGTLAHEIAEHALTRSLEGIYDPIIDDAIPLKDEHLKNPLFSIDMANYIRDYCNYVIGENYEMQKADGKCRMYLERRVNITDFAPDSFGSVDIVLVSDKTIHIIDLKYGAGVKVTADHNEQMMMYALGALKDLGALKVRFPTE